MSFQDILQLIGSYAFPIIACVAIFTRMTEDAKAYREEIRRISEEHKAEVNNMTKAINNNTQAIQHLLDTVGGN